MVMGEADRISGAFWFLFSLFMSYQSYKLGLGSLHQPGPGFIFFWTSVVTAVLSIIVIARTFTESRHKNEKTSLFGKMKLAKLALVLVSLFLYALLLERLGFIVITFLLFIFLLAIVEKKRWWFAVGVSVAVTTLSFLVFETGLQSQLPKGLLEFLRF